MSNLKSQIAEHQKEAMKSGDKVRLSTLRMLGAAISNKEIDFRKKDVGLSDEEILDVIRSEVKKRKDSIAEFQKAGRAEMAQNEAAEMTVLQSYLPPELSDEELTRIVKDGIRESGANSQQDFAKVMKLVMPTLKGKASGDRISKILKEELSA